MDTKKKTLTYSSGNFIIDKVKFPSSFVAENFPQYVVANEIKQIFYRSGGTNNKIVFNDNSTSPLPQEDPHYDALLLDHLVIHGQYLDYVATEKQRREHEMLALRASVKIKDLFRHDITPEEQQEKLNILERTGGTLNDEFLFKNLDRIKKKLLVKSDYSQLPDIQATLTEEEKTAWIDYRAALRVLDKVIDPLDARIPLAPDDV